MQYEFLDRLGIKKMNSGVSFGNGFLEKPSGGIIASINPSNEEVIARVVMGGEDDYEKIIEEAGKGFQKWKDVPAPKRALIVREFVEEISRHKEDLGKLTSLEVGKIQKEGEGEVQEVIDLEVISSGLARGDAGSRKPSERTKHELYTRYDPLGRIGIIPAFNFPIAVPGWNWTHAVTQGNAVIIKPSLETPLCAIAIQNIFNRVNERHNNELSGIFNLVIGENETVGEAMIRDESMPLISFTGSTTVGRHVAQVVAKRLGRCLLELGGNNYAIVLDDADLPLAIENIFFGFVGTTGQRCTSTRRVFVYKKHLVDFIKDIEALVLGATFDDPLNPQSTAGPLINEKAVQKYFAAIDRAEKEGGMIVHRGKRLERPGFFVTPTIVFVQGKKQLPIMFEETFAPLLYVMEIDDLDEGIVFGNEALHQLSSAIFTRDINAAYYFREKVKTGIRNINCGTSGAESTTPFGGNFNTGWGREAGGDAWRSYVLESAGAVNYSGETELAQGIQFKKK